MNGSDVSIAIPTYNRGEILVETIELLLAQDPPAAEILIVDQTPSHPGLVHKRLDAWSRQGTTRETFDSSRDEPRPADGDASDRPLSR